MGLLDTHAEGIRQAFDFSLRAPQPDEPPASFNLWSFAGVGFRALGRAGLETGANFADLSASLEQGRINSLPASSFSEDEKARRAADLLTQKTQAQDFATSLRRRSQEMAPDPLTSHRADQVLSQVGTGVTRAVGAIATLGPAAGSAAFGLGEGDSAYQDAIARGIDPATAAKLGVVTGVVAGATAAVPAGGSTVAKSLGIAAAAGPGAFVAQEALSKKILQSAGYTDEAAMHDPTDPLGLALSIAIPGVAAGLHIRSIGRAKTVADVALDLESKGKRFGADGKLLTSSAGAEGERQVMPATQVDPGFGVRPAALGPDGKPTPDEIARVGVDYIAAMQNRYGGDAAKTLAAYNAGPGRLDAAIKEHGADWLAHMPDETRAYVQKGLGQLHDSAVRTAAADPATVDAARVRVTNDALMAHLPDHPDALPELWRATDAVAAGPVHEVVADPRRVALETERTNLEAQRAQLLPVAGEAADRGAIADVRTRLAALEQQRPDDSVPAVKAAAKQIQTAEGVSFKQAQTKAQKQVAEAVSTHEGQVANLQAAIDRNTAAAQAAQQLAALDARHTEVSRQLEAVPLTSVRPAAPRATALAAREAARPEPGAPKAAAPAPDLFRPRVPGTREAAPDFAPAPPKAEAPGAAPAPKPAGESKPAMVKVEPPSLEVQRAEALLADNPELRVQLPGSTQTVSAAEALARVKAEAAHEAGESELIRAAVQCALSFGD